MLKLRVHRSAFVVGYNLVDVLAIGNDLPVLRSNQASLVRSFQVWLVKAWEDNMALCWLKLCVDVLRVVLVIPEILEALTVIDVVRFEFNRDLIHTLFLVLDWNVNTMVLPDNDVGRVFHDLLAIGCNLVDSFTLVVDEKTLRFLGPPRSLGESEVDRDLPSESFTTFDEAHNQSVVDIRYKLFAIYGFNFGQEVIGTVSGVFKDSCRAWIILFLNFHLGLLGLLLLFLGVLPC